jgi:autophagy-related protein 9
MSKKTRYTRLETDPESSDSDEAPPTNIHSSQAHRGNRWNHIENLDEFYEWVYQYLINHGWMAILLNDILELFQFAFLCIFSAFLITCLNFDNLFADNIYTIDNETKNVQFGDVIQLSRINDIHPVLVLMLLLAFIFWFHRFCKMIWRAWKFWEIRTFYSEALKIPPSQLRNHNWLDVLLRLKTAQIQYKMNIRKQELTELGVIMICVIVLSLSSLLFRHLS